MIEYLVVVLVESTFSAGPTSYRNHVRAPYTINGFASAEACKRAAGNVIDAKRLGTETMCLAVNKESGATDILIHYRSKNVP